MVGFILLHGVLPVVVFALAFLIEKKYAEASFQENMSQLWTQASLLKTLYISFAVVIGFALLVLFVNLYSVIISLEWGGKPRVDGTLAPINVQNLALAFIGTVSGFGALFGVFLAILRSEENKRQSDSAEREATTAEQGLITDRLNKATEGLGKKDGESPVIEVRLGALYALERIAQDSIRDHVPIMEILCDYLRHNSPWLDKTKKSTKAIAREDIQTALAIIGRRGNGKGGEERLKKEREQEYRINLIVSDLHGAHLPDATFIGARFNHSNLKQTYLYGANLSSASFDTANLHRAWIGLANMSGVILDNANMKDAITEKAFAYEGDFSKCHNLTQDQINQMFCGIGVKIPHKLTRPEHWPTDTLSYDKFYNAYENWMVADFKEKGIPPFSSL